MNKSEILQFKKILSRSVCCLHAGSWYKSFIILNLFYLRFCFGPDACTGNFGFTICGVVPWHGSVRNNNLTSHTHTHTHQTHTHTPYFLKISLTDFFFTPLAVHTWYFSCVTVTNRDWPTFVECCPILRNCAIISNVSFTRRNRESIHISFAKGRVTKT